MAPVKTLAAMPGPTDGRRTARTEPRSPRRPPGRISDEGAPGQDVGLEGVMASAARPSGDSPSIVRRHPAVAHFSAPARTPSGDPGPDGTRRAWPGKYRSGPGAPAIHQRCAVRSRCPSVRSRCQSPESRPDDSTLFASEARRIAHVERRRAIASRPRPRPSHRPERRRGDDDSGGGPRRSPPL